MDRAIPFIEKAVEAGKPFFTVIWFHAPHGPVVRHPKYMKELYSDLPENVQHYYSVVTALDAQVGVLRDKLNELGVAENTIICFTSDNGPAGTLGNTKRHQGSTGNFRGRKASIYEGGIRVPSVIEWPAVLPKNTEVDVPLVTSDYFPSICHILGLDVPSDRPIDGINLLEILKGKQKVRGKNIGYQYKKQKALNGERFKLVQNIGPDRDKHDNGAVERKEFELYDILNDPSETKNVSAEYPEIFEEMKSELTAFVESCERSDRGLDY